ncbi:ABC transporter ATP-binding protein [Exiguobacterium acetylicum]|uniref:ABC transporter ATP-binding protein n=1 Tax=Exiguobacterium acetylicum TaxID=41170 RepID=UPI003875D393
MFTSMNRAGIRRLIHDILKNTHHRLWYVVGWTSLNAVTSTLGIALILPLLSLIFPISGTERLHLGWINLNWLTLERMLLLYIVLVCISVWINRQTLIQTTILVQRYTKFLRIRLFETLFSSDYHYIARQKKSNILNQFTMEIARISISVTALISMISGILITIPHLVLAWYISPRLTGFVFVSGIVVFVSLYTSLRRVRQLALSLSDSNQRWQQHLHEQLYGVKEIRSYGIEAKQTDAFRQATEEIEQNLVQYATEQSKPDAVFKIVAAVLISLFFYISLSFLNEEIGTLLVIVLLFARLWPLFAAFQKNMQLFLSGLSVYASLQATLDHIPKSIQGEDSLRPFQKSIELNHVSFSYTDAEMSGLQDVSLTIHSGQMIAIMGASGTGKSTLLDLVLGLLEPQTGEIRIDGQMLKQEKTESWRKQISYIPQSAFLFHGTIRQNIVHFHPGLTEEELLEALELAGATFVHELPDGLETIIGDFGARLSGGQQQKIILARALAKRPRLLLFDEATNAMDREQEVLFHKTLRHLTKRMTIVYITHRIEISRLADAIYHIETGRLEVKEGSHS